MGVGGISVSKRVTMTCSVCGKERSISKEQVARIGAGKARNICRSCARWLSGRYGNGGIITCPDCGEKRKASARTLGRIANGEMTERCRSCAARKRVQDLGIRYGEESNGWRGGNVKVICAQCNKEIERYPSSIAPSGKTFCSVECCNTYRWANIKKEDHPRWKGGPDIMTCEWCGKAFEIRVSRKKGEGRFCSRACLGMWISKYRSGEDSAHWHGGKNNESYSASFNRRLKQRIRRRDSYHCALCGDEGSIVHHVDYDKSNAEMNNLVTLCRSCHGKTNHKRESYTAILSQMVNAMQYSGFMHY